MAVQKSQQLLKLEFERMSREYCIEGRKTFREAREEIFFDICY